MDEARHEDFLQRFTRAQPALRRFVFAHLPDFHQAEDAMQQVALVLWKKFNTFRQDQDFTRWAFGVARHEVLHARRSVSRDRLLTVPEMAERFADRLVALSPQLDERRRYLAQCLAKLSDKQRRAIDLRYRQNRSAPEIATTLDSSANAVRILLSRTRRALVDCLKRMAAQAAENPA